MTAHKSFTAKANGLANSLMSEVGICEAYIPMNVPESDWPKFKGFRAIWDTGATASVITGKVVDELGLKPVGKAKVNHAHGVAETEAYLVNIGLPNQVGFAGIRVTKGDLAGTDVLIGMDIIGQGDFAVTNKDGKTTFSFRVPSVQEIDFTKTSVIEAPIRRGKKKIGRNEPCPCGSGKKHKKCCGA